MNLQSASALEFVHAFWEKHVLPTLKDYIKIPNQSPSFHEDWERTPHMDNAVEVVRAWCVAHGPCHMRLNVHKSPGRTPLLLMEIPGQLPGHVLLYGHLDKQPPNTGWRADLGPWTPVREGDRLYGRGGADDGYAVFAAIGAIALLEAQGVPYPNCRILIECSEESGSPDLPHYLERLGETIGTPDLVICLDSGCGNYEQLWVTSSLRGLIGGNLTAEVLTEGVHSGDASGVAPSSFRIIRHLLDRIEDSATGHIRAAFQTDISAEIHGQLRQAAEALGPHHFQRLPFTGSLQTVGGDTFENLLNRTWRAALEITGAGGLPDLKVSGNVLRPLTTVKLSLRLPPTVDANAASEALARILLADPPYNARVTYTREWCAPGWQSPAFSPWLETGLQAASNAFFGQPALHMGEGFSIPFMSMLAKAFPAAQFVVTGVVGPHANAHGPNEFLHLGMAKKLTACVGEIISRLK